MTSQPAFTYPIAHSTFIPLSYQSVTTSGQTRKRKRTKSLGTEPGQEDDDDEDVDRPSDGEDDEKVAENENLNAVQRQSTGNGNDSSSGGLRGPVSQTQTPTAVPWTPVIALTPASVDGEPDDENNTSNDETVSEETRKSARGNLEHRIRNAGYDEDITDALPPTQPSSLHAKHMSNLNTILHLCLLRRDWKRAKRAFKLLLLSDSETDVRNLRLKGIWKLGVEILSWEDENATTDDQGDSPPNKDYTKAMEYMNRLVIMYPHYKHYVIGKGVNATTILPILMHFEILALHDKLSTALTTGEATVVIEVIAGITAVTDRLKSLQETPPWVDMVELWKLRGQLYTWAADLSLTLLNDEKTHIKYKIIGHKLALKMKERRIPEWKEFAFEYDGEIIDDEDDSDAMETPF
ncbi:hypothetical protein AA313_de0200971 [Arthrobotrys entomopaga]|nr:hypothetical protein AA313_de0200971 [Arthrobotrys entomopaga]